MLAKTIVIHNGPQINNTITYQFNPIFPNRVSRETVDLVSKHVNPDKINLKKLYSYKDYKSRVLKLIKKHKNLFVLF